jgi:Tol biopolymer transport system component
VRAAAAACRRATAFAGTTTVISVPPAGGLGNAYPNGPSVSANGRYVGFYSTASNLVAGDTNGTNDVFVYDRVAKTYDRVSVHDDHSQFSHASSWPAISADGRFVAF